MIAGSGAGLVGFVGLLRLCEYAAGREFAVDEWFFHFHREQLGLAPIGKMSLPTAIAFVAASSAVVRCLAPSMEIGPSRARGGGGWSDHRDDGSGLQPRLPVQPERAAALRHRVDTDGTQHGVMFPLSGSWPYLRRRARSVSAGKALRSVDRRSLVADLPPARRGNSRGRRVVDSFPHDDRRVVFRRGLLGGAGGCRDPVVRHDLCGLPATSAARLNMRKPSCSGPTTSLNSKSSSERAS